MPRAFFITSSWLLISCISTNSDVNVYMNKIWPVSNPSETYRYYDAPFCQPHKVEWQIMSLGQVFRGDRIVSSPYDIEFMVDKEKTSVCEHILTEDDIDEFHFLINEGYMFELFVNELPVDRSVGVKVVHGDLEGNEEKPKYLLLNNFEFSLGYNQGQVVSANVTGQHKEYSMQEVVDITDAKPGDKLEFFYSVKFVQSDILPEEALEVQIKQTSNIIHQNMEIHWLAIVNSSVLMLLIFSLFVLIIVRVVRSDLSRYLQISDEELNAVEEDSGWKLLHGDVFRPPKHRLVFCAAMGSGIQLLTMAFGVVLVGCVGVYYHRGAVASTLLVFYLITAAIAGYVSSSLYQKLGGEKWAWNICITASAFTGPAFLIWAFLNTVAISYNSTAAFPFTTILLIILLWACVTFPLTVFGGIMGRRHAMKLDNPFPTKTNRLAREIPKCAWYQNVKTQFIAVGFLPFSAIYIELHYIFISIWGSRLYTLYGVLLIAFLMLLMVAATVSVLFTYFHLNAEDYRWWWRSMGSGVAIAGFFYGYCVFFFMTSEMTGFLQCSFFFLYSLLAAYGLGLMLGAVSFGATFFFVTYIYARIKAE